MNLNFKICILLKAILLSGSVAFTQLNESDTLKFQIRTSASGALQIGNVDLLIVRGNVDLVMNGHKDLVFKSQNNSLFQQFDDYKADNDINSRNYLYYKPSRRIYPFAMFFAQTNFRRKIDYRFFGGLGITFQTVRTKNSNIKFSASVVHEKTLFSTNQFSEVYYNGVNDIALWRTTVYIAGIHKMSNRKIRVFYNAYWQPAFEPVPNNRVQIDIGVEMSVWKGLRVNTQYIFNYEQVVAEKIKQIDRILIFGLSYQLNR
jgi:hypothetical protein